MSKNEGMKIGAERKFSIVIAAYNEEGGIGDTLSGLVKEYSDVAEILVVNDGSTDSTAAVAAGFPEITLVNHRRNFGYGAALKTGIIEASTDIVCFFDADGQHDPKDIAKLIENMQDSHMIVGARTQASHKILARYYGKFMLKFMSEYIAQRRIPDLNSGLRAVRREAILRYIHLLPDGFSASTTMTMTFLVRRYDVRFVPIVTQKRIGTSQVKFLRDGFGTMMLLLRMAMMFDPLRIFVPISMVFTTLGVTYGTYWMLFKVKMGYPVGALFITLVGVFAFILGLLADQISAIRQERFETISTYDKYTVGQ